MTQKRRIIHIILYDLRQKMLQFSHSVQNLTTCPKKNYKIFIFFLGMKQNSLYLCNVIQKSSQQIQNSQKRE